MPYVSLIFDLGKTNKKALVFDEALNCLEEQQVSIPEVQGAEGLLYDDAAAMSDWMDGVLATYCHSKKYTLRAVNITTFGATVAHLQADGNLACPIFSYLCRIPEAVYREFVEFISALPGGFARLATPPLPHLLNVGTQLFWLSKTQPEMTRRITRTLFLPQYLVYRLTGRAFSEATSLGCHTALWDFQAQSIYQPVIEKTGWTDKLPPLAPVETYIPLLDTYQNGRAETPIVAGTGLHDSSSALIPFRRALGEDFVLLSTGTWIIAQNPGAPFRLSATDLAEDRLYYLTPEQAPVRAARLFAGREHDLQLKRITRHFGRPPAWQHAEVERFLPAFFSEIAERMLKPAVLSGSGPFPNWPAGEWDLTAFASPEEAYARLCLDLAVLTHYCTESVSTEQTDAVVIDGGFARNTWFVRLLAMLQAPQSVYATDLPQATALGAALMVHPAWATLPSPEQLVALTQIEATPVAGLRIYAERFLNAVRDKCT